MTGVSAVVVSHGDASELPASLAALAPQVDELVVIANVPGSVGETPPGTRVLENERPRGFAANANRGIAETVGEHVVLVNPDAVAEPGAVATLRAFADAHPRCGVAGPRMVGADGELIPSRRRFPTVRGTLVRRTPVRRLRPPLKHQHAHYHLGEDATEPVQADWLLGGFVLLRRRMLEELGGFDPGFRLYGEEIDVCYRAAKAGWERWYVPAAVVHHAWKRETDVRFFTRRTLWHWRGIARFVRKHPETLGHL
jgi:N-acetylglucosaminyl-diphospho-decaprenol L-rhamnosyltransferase